MTIPESPLELDVDVEHLKIGDAGWLDNEQWTANAFTATNRLRLFLHEHSVSWTHAEIDDIEFGELKVILPQVWEVLNRLAVPFLSSTPSRTGPEAKQTEHRRRGRSTTAGQKPSAATPKASRSGVSWRAWRRWLLLEQARAARQLWKEHGAAGPKADTPEGKAEREDWQWAMLKDKF